MRLEGGATLDIALCGFLIAIAGAVACEPGPARTEDAMDDGASHESARLSLRFRHPDSFMVGRFAEEKLPPGFDDQGFESPFRNAVVLVEPGQLGPHLLDAIPLGEIPTVWVDLVTNPIILSMLESGEEMTLGGRRAFKFPGYPGPYGDQAHFYVAELAPGAYVEVMAHRFYFRGAETDAGLRETEYDVVIEKIIASLEPIAP